MQPKMKICKNCIKPYGATNSNQSYCCDVCRQQAYYKRHGIDRPKNYIQSLTTPHVNHTFTPIIEIKENAVNESKKEIEQITPAPVNNVTPLIQTTHKTMNNDNLSALLEQMNKTHQAQMEAMEIRLKLSFAQQLHEKEKQAKDDVISRLESEIKEKENKSDISTSQVLGGLTAMISGIDINDLIKAKA